ncbi:MAG: BTAD domain-containing putative transcriptional regulator, partial [Aquihabitans sp.]
GVTNGVDLAELVMPDHGASVDRFELFDAVADVVATAASQDRVVVVIDDIHGADPPSILLLHFLVAHLRSSPVLFIATYRDLEMAERPDVVALVNGLERLSTTLHLDGLGADEVEALAVDPASAMGLHAITGGNPLFIEQVLDVGAADLASEDTEHPPELMTILARRLHRSAQPVRDLLAALAVLGPAGRLADLPMIVDMDQAMVAMLLDDAAEAGLIDADRSWFEHPLIAEAAQLDVDSDQRASLHRRAARLLMGHPGAALDRARHLAQVGPEVWSETVAAYRDAARLATASLAYEDSVDHLRRAHALVEQHGEDPGEAVEVLLDLAGATFAALGRQAAEELYQDAWVRAVATGDPDLIGRAAMRSGIQYFFNGDVISVVADQSRHALSILGDDADEPLRARLHANLAAALLLDDPAVATHHAATAMALARDGHEPVALATALVAEQVVDLGPSTLSRRLHTAREIVALGEEAGDRDLVVHGRFLLMAGLLERGDIGELDAQLNVQDEIIDTVASARFARHALWFRAMRAMLDGDTQQIEAIAGSCYEIAAGLDDPDGEPVFWGQIGVARWIQGRLLEMEHVYLEQRRREPDDPLWGSVLAWIWSQAGQLDSARGALATLPPLSETTQGMHTLLHLATTADAAVAVGDDELVAEAWNALLPYADRIVPVGMGAAVWGTVARPLARLALHLGHVDEGITHLEQAIAVCARLGARPWLAEAQLELAAALLEHRPEAEGRIAELVDEAAATVHRCDLTVFEERVAELQSRVGGSAGDTASPPQVWPAPATGRPRVQVLGTFEVTAVDGSSPRWTSRKARELLKILVARRGTPVAREVLMNLLWPDEDPGLLKNRLSVALSTVRRALDPERSLPSDALLATESSSVYLTLTAVEVDVETFLAAAEQALAAHRAGQPDAARLLHVAVDLHGGPALPDEPYAPWAENLRMETDSALATVLRTLAESSAAAGDDLKASTNYRRLLELDGFDEPAHRGLVNALHALGAHGQALAAYQRYCQAMEEIGVPTSFPPP